MGWQPMVWQEPSVNHCLALQSTPRTRHPQDTPMVPDAQSPSLGARWPLRGQTVQVAGQAARTGRRGLGLQELQAPTPAGNRLHKSDAAGAAARCQRDRVTAKTQASLQRDEHGRDDLSQSGWGWTPLGLRRTCCLSASAGHSSSGHPTLRGDRSKFPNSHRTESASKLIRSGLGVHV